MKLARQRKTNIALYPLYTDSNNNSRLELGESDGRVVAISGKGWGK